MQRIRLAILLCVLLPGLALAETVRLEHDGIRLNANLSQTDNWPAGPVVLLTHGTLAHSGMEIIKGLQGMLADRGLSSLAINLSLGLDDRVAQMYDCATPHRHQHTDAVAEIAAWVDWLKGQGAEQIVLLGHSRGGNQTARYAAGTPDAAVSHVVLMAPQTWESGKAAAEYAKRYGTELASVLADAQAQVDAGKGDDLMGPMGFIYCEGTQASATAVLSYYREDPDYDTPSLLARIDRPVMVFAGSADDVVDGLIEKTEAVADGERIQLEVIDGAGHFFRDLYSEDVADIVMDWVDQ